MTDTNVSGRGATFVISRRMTRSDLLKVRNNWLCRVALKVSHYRIIVYLNRIKNPSIHHI